MTKGSVLVWHGSLWHGGGANATDERRVGIAVNYCAGWIRQQENQQLGLSPSLVAGFDPRLRELVGYGIYQPAAYAAVRQFTNPKTATKRPIPEDLRALLEREQALDGSANAGG